MVHSPCITEYRVKVVRKMLSRGLIWRSLHLHTRVIISNPMKSRHHQVQGGVQHPPVVHYDNPLFDAEDFDADYHNEPLRFRTMSDLIGPAVPLG
jgi:hypothetical protein